MVGTAETQLIYAGTFDPFTHGHQHIVERVMRYFPSLIIAIAADTAKATLFSADERLALIQAILPAVNAVIFQGLLIDFARHYPKPLLLRGLRHAQDFTYEAQLAHVNQQLLPGLETLFIVANAPYTSISASMVREIARLGGVVNDFVAAQTSQALQQKYQQ